jgi:hypothetical protein
MLRRLALVLLLAPAAAGASGRSTNLHVSATVVRSVTVSVGATSSPSGPALVVRSPDGRAWSVPLRDAVRRGGEIGAGACGGDPRCVLVTVHADAASPARE